MKFKKHIFIYSLILVFFVCFVDIPEAHDLQDEKFLNMIESDTFQYFLEYVNPKTGLVADSSRSNSPCSIAAVGFGLTALCVAAERQWITREEASRRVLKTLKFLYEKTPNVRGFYYHFINMISGKRMWSCEISSIDTAILVAGALTCSEYFKNKAIKRLANKIYKRIEWDWMLNNGDYLSMGWKPEEGFLPYYWDHFSELMILYALAIGSPTFPIDKSYWKKWTRPESGYGPYKFIFCPTGSLFIYQYSHAWIDFRNIEDEYADYWENSVNAVLANRLFCMNNAKNYESYDKFLWGLSACIGPDGYKGYGGGPGNTYHDGTIAPSAVTGSLPFKPEICIRTLRYFYTKLGYKIYGKCGFFNGFNIDRDWVAAEFLGIDNGITVLMIENYRTGFVWEYFMKNPAIKKWIKLCMKKK